MVGRCRLLLVTLLLFAPLQAADPPLTQWIVVTAPAFREAVEPLCEHRRAQRLRVVVVSVTDFVDERALLAGQMERLQNHLAHLCRSHAGPSQILLVGALEPHPLKEPGRRLLPSLRGTTGRMMGQPTDNGYGLPDETLLPSVAVGRLPARTPEEARAMVHKILTLEKDTAPGPWRRRLTVLAGAPEFNPLIDAAVERLAIAQLARIDPSWYGRALYHNPQSRFSLPDDLCHARARAYVEEGQALALYLGHSNERGFQANRDRYLDRDDWATLSIRRGPGIFATFGCLGCRLIGPDGEGYGVAAIRNPRGPAAVVGSHGICFAAMVKLASEAFTDSLLGPKPPESLGTSWLRLKEGLARGKIDPLTYRLLDGADGDSRIPQAVQRCEHQEMFVLLGDPALRLPRIPDDLELKWSLESDGRLAIQGHAPARLEGANVVLTLERPRDSNPATETIIPAEPAAERRQALLTRHERANDFAVARAETVIRKGRFSGTVSLPEKRPWPKLIVRAYAASATEEGMAWVRWEEPAKP